MTDKQVINRIKLVYGIFISVLILTFLVLCACSIIFGIDRSNIAHASVSDGYVGNNLIDNIDFSSDVPYISAENALNGSNFQDFGGWFTRFTDQNMFLAQYSGFSTFSNGTNRNAYILHPMELSIGTYTVTICCQIISGTLRGGFYQENDQEASAFSNITSSTSLSSYSYTFTLTATSKNFGLGITSLGSINLYWIKIEAGSSFTGFVPKDYTNYGYEQGYAGGSASVERLQTSLSAYGFQDTWTGTTTNDISTYDWFMQNYFTSEGWGSLYINYSNLPVGSIITMNLPFYRYGLCPSGSSGYSNYTWYNSVNIMFAFGYASELPSRTPPDYAQSIRLNQGTSTYSFTSNRGGDSLVLYFPTNLFTNADKNTFALSWYGNLNDVYFTTSSIGADLEAQLDNAYSEGKKAGVSIGKSEGYVIGYNEALSEYEGASFIDLLGAVFDAPITAIIGKAKYNDQGVFLYREGGLLNFEILGTNISVFVTALISIGIVLFVLRIFIRGF